MRKYVGSICRAAGLLVHPLRLVDGRGRRTSKLIYATVEERVDSWYFYVLLPHLTLRSPCPVPRGTSTPWRSATPSTDVKLAAMRREASRGGGCFAEDDPLPPPPRRCGERAIRLRRLRRHGRRTTTNAVPSTRRSCAQRGPTRSSLHSSA